MLSFTLVALFLLTLRESLYFFASQFPFLQMKILIVLIPECCCEKEMSDNTCTNLRIGPEITGSDQYWLAGKLLLFSPVIPFD